MRREVEGGSGGVDGGEGGGADGESEEQDDEEDMMEMLGFGGFGSTKVKLQSSGPLITVTVGFYFLFISISVY